MKTLEGQFLVASPHLADGNFNKSVVLMVKHDSDGAFGVILNRPTDKTIREVWRLVTEEEVDSEEPIFVGGPVSGMLVAIHGVKGAKEAEIAPGVYFSADKDHLYKIVGQTKKPFRLFLGYAGWAGGQLEGELELGGWLTAPVTKELVFHQGDDLWEQVLRSIGEDFLGSTIKARHVPDDPSLN
jgi:putative transcriptional regulator